MSRQQQQKRAAPLESQPQQPPQQQQQQTQLQQQALIDKNKERKRKEAILDLSKYLDKGIRVKFSGGREVSGILKGHDPLLNLVLDGTIEYLTDPVDPYKLTEDTRTLGLVVCRGTSVVSIPNPFIQQES
ncbi:U6 snRNA-associated Sm-like protein LSm7 [Argonauta hians]